MRPPIRIVFALLAAAPVAVAATTPSALAAPGPSHEVASGSVPTSTGAFPWRVGVARNSIGRIPGLCLTLDHSWNADGSSFGNVATNCVAGSVGGRFSLHASRCRGVFAAIGRASAGSDTIRKLAFAVDRRAHILKVAFPGGERVSAHTVAAPRALRLPVRIGWVVDGGTAFPARVAAYGAARRGGKRPLVGRWKAGAGC